MVLLVARLLLAFLFVSAGLQKLGDMQTFTQYLVSGGLPAFLAWPAALFEVVAGLAIIAGFFTRLTALLLAGFCIAAAILYHLKPDDPMMMAMFAKNLAIAGGFLVLFVHGPGPLSVDARMRPGRS